MANLWEVNPLYCPAYKYMNECMGNSNSYKNTVHTERSNNWHSVLWLLMMSKRQLFKANKL